MGSIFIIDDNPNEMEFYIESCVQAFSAKNIDVVYCQNPTIADARFQSLKTEPLAILLDIMFIPFQHKEGNEEGGFDRGIEYYRILKDRFKNTSILVFTNRTTRFDELLSQFESKELASMDRFYEKTELDPSELVAVLEEMTSE